MSEPGKAVFLSYASQDAEAAKRICEALRAAGVEVWFDAEGGLEHGDEWDAKIRRQIKECVLFLPLISANTQAREEGYFRIEWELAAQRALGIASGVAFILPVVIDGTREPDALVPDRFRSVQWTKLPGGNVPPDVLARFLKLWSHRAGVIKHEAVVSRQRTEDRGQEAAAKIASPGWKIYAGLAVAVFALAGGAVWWLGRGNNPVPVSAAPRPPSAANLPAVSQSNSSNGPALSLPNGLSEARQLAEKARAMFDSLDGTRDDYKLAEELIVQAKAKDATDAEVCAAEAQLHERYYQRGWDPSDARREAARAAVQRAIRLDPQSFEARWAQASLLAYTGNEGEEKVRQLRELRRERPTDKRILRTLGSVLDRLGRLEEAIPIFDESAALPGGDPLSLYSKSQAFWFAGRTAEAEAAIEASIAQKPFTSALLMNVWYKATLHGELDPARALLNRINPAELIEDRASFFAFYIEWLARRPDAAIARLTAVPRDWLNDNFHRGPKAALIGDAQQLAGRPDAAVLEWRAALKLVEQRLAASPNDARLLSHRFGLLIRLGQREEAERLLGVLVQVLGSNADATPVAMSRAYTLLGRKAEAISQISAGLKRDKRAVLFTAADLRLNPNWDPLRGDPAFAAVIAEAEAIEKAAAIAATPPRDWPKNAELKKAVALLDGLELIPEDFRLAEEIAQRVLDRNPTDPEGVTVMARVHSMWLLRGWDRSTARYQKAKATAERAIQLAPDEPEAYTALAIHLYARGAEPQRAVDLAQRAVDLCPQEPRFHRIRDNCLWVANVPAGSVFSDQNIEPENEGLRKALAASRRTVELFPKDPLVRYELSRHYRDIGRWADFERVNEEVLALAPLANAFVWKARGRFGLHGDLPGMKAVLDQVPARVRGIERTVYAYFLYAAFTGRTADGLDALNSMTESWMIDFDYRGPKSLLTAALLELGGKKELARVQYTAALDELLRARTLNAEDPQTYLNEAWIKHALGRADEARAALRIFNESLTRPYVISPMSTWWFQAIPANLLLGERETALTLMREAATGVLPGRATIRSRLALDPRMAPFRADPEIIALLAEPEAKK